MAWFVDIKIARPGAWLFSADQFTQHERHHTAAHSGGILAGNQENAGPWPVLFETAVANTPIEFLGYCGTFDVRNGQLIHHIEFNYIRPSLNGTVERRSVNLEGDQLTLAAPEVGLAAVCLRPLSGSASARWSWHDEQYL
jgi:hypothetical protein